jgi:hypothetical protein
MRWWLNTDHKAFSFENALVLEQMDFSSLPANVWMVQWTDDRGEIEYQDAEGNNLNGIRDNFTDITPYVPFFQQFMSHLAGITLAQAKKVQSELITLLYETKRQLPYAHTIAAGAFSWDATDAAVTAMTAVTIPALLGGTSGSGSSLTGLINAQFAALVASINTHIVGIGNFTVIPQINSRIVDAGNASIAFTHIDQSFEQVSVSPVTPGTATLQFTPIGQGTPVTVTLTEMSDIMTGISSRRQSLLTTQFNKTAAVNAMTTISDVIAYDVTLGW